MLEFSDTIFASKLFDFMFVFPNKNVYLFLVNDVAGNEQFEDSEESGVESDKADDGDEDCPDCLHLVGQDSSSHSQNQDQQVDDLKLIKSVPYWEGEVFAATQTE